MDRLFHGNETVEAAYKVIWEDARPACQMIRPRPGVIINNYVLQLGKGGTISVRYLRPRPNWQPLTVIALSSS